ncbi:hypothetical protein SAMD00019534_049580 [Acytostelium subglobosum LB1]|uniref:hypothetical protein n=1 Tax=Acytostelium subglobosum LB1 TaxID=1410327 RepID=UPI000644B908|nr:hypothetical protein SAMD00019534_049580 [Acytostelium subglobosum LB1]GAM21783.1 hypothetical protein SAMD00019534_049580 [Acytostelium subglobosum LB1]|eukprot:XP_012754883.1 hypothetical protein SAMD00019534_049580 [Acytostelium subglobosum LB1]
MPEETLRSQVALLIETLEDWIKVFPRKIFGRHDLKTKADKENPAKQDKKRRRASSEKDDE